MIDLMTRIEFLEGSGGEEEEGDGRRGGGAEMGVGEAGEGVI
jgi:hypothetical protein